ncbi:hypothetical protein [Cupriavidus sp. AcVe19-6a]|uniref:hypothetical protein n=1 Tax=Cupriavidus sp. AcVe19-6a TaxID=2821358 RepID=UPI00352C6A91
MQTVFQLIQETGSAYAFVKRFVEEGMRFPERAYGGAWAVRLIWGRLSHGRVLGLIHNQSYAGAYAFWRYQYRQRPQKRSISECSRYPRRVHLPDHYEGDLSPRRNSSAIRRAWHAPVPTAKVPYSAGRRSA